MIGMSTKFKPRSLEEAYDIFFRSCKYFILNYNKIQAMISRY